MAEDTFLRDGAARQRQLETLEKLSQRFGQSLSTALATGTKGGQQLDSVLGSIGTRLATSLGNKGISSLEGMLQQGLQSAVQSLSAAASLGSFGGDLFPFARGGVVAGGRVQPFATGGVVSAPTYFPMANGLGLMGEAGPEAVMPLARGPDGRLGVRTGQGGTAPTINVTIQAADLDSFKRSEAQVSASLARAVARGRRAT
jgi:phage-related minor tail protein